MRALLAAGCAAWLAAGCAVGPDYTPPLSAVPATFAEAGAADARVLAAWWRSFGDPRLDGLVERALAGAPDLRLAAARLQQARALRGVAAAARGPTVSAGGEVDWVRQSANGQLPAPRENPDLLYEVGFDAAWELDLFGAVARRVEVAEAELGEAEALAHDARVRLVAEVVREYSALRTAEAQRAAAERTAAAVDARRGLAAARADAGLLAAGELLRLDAEVREAVAAVPPFVAAAAAAEHRLEVLVGAIPGALRAELAAPGPDLAPAGAVPPGLPAELLRRRPDVRAAERAVAASVARLGVATADLFPRLSLSGRFGLSSAGSGDLFEAASRAFSIGPAVQVPLFTGGRLRAAEAGAAAARDVALIGYERTVLAALAEVEDGLAGRAQAAARLAALREAAAADGGGLAVAEAQERAGLAGHTAVLAAAEVVARRDLEVAGAAGQLATATVALYKALGGGWDAP